MLKVECTKDGTNIACGGSTLEVIHHALCAISAIHTSLKDNLDPEIVSFFEEEAIKELSGEAETPYVIKKGSEVRSTDNIVAAFKKLRKELGEK